MVLKEIHIVLKVSALALTSHALSPCFLILANVCHILREAMQQTTMEGIFITYSVLFFVGLKTFILNRLCLPILPWDQVTNQLKNDNMQTNIR